MFLSGEDRLAGMDAGLKVKPYRAPLAAGSYWSSEHPLDAPQLSITQVGGTDHDVVARHWIKRTFM